jgi:glycosyltransferase involved in cell wall biosynthesis
MEQRINWSSQGFAGRVKLLVGQQLIARTELKLFSLADRLHVLSDFTKQTITSLYGDRIAAKVQKVPWWQDPCSPRLTKEEARRELGWPLHGAVFLTLRRMVPRMGLDVFLSALEYLAEKHNFTAVLAGDGPERGRLMQRASTGRLAGRVIFPGHISEAELPLAYQAADAFVLPTIALEGFGIIILEAWANGCPVIASSIGAIPELLNPISPQCLVEPANARALSEVLEQFLTAGLKLPGAEELINHVAGRYSRDILLPEYLRLLMAPLSNAQAH